MRALVVETAPAVPLPGAVVDGVDRREVALEELDQVEGQAEQMSLHALGRGGTGPSVVFTEFVFELVEGFLQVPAPPLDEADQSG